MGAPPERHVIEWPANGSARRYPVGGWWLVEERPACGFTPLAGPFKTKAQAEAANWYELTPADVGRPWIQAFGRTWLVSSFLGQVLAGDVGKRVFRRGDILQVENDEQRAARLGRTR
jgi:hypothetical protein